MPSCWKEIFPNEDATLFDLEEEEELCILPAKNTDEYAPICHVAPSNDMTYSKFLLPAILYAIPLHDVFPNSQIICSLMIF